MLISPVVSVADFIVYISRPKILLYALDVVVLDVVLKVILKFDLYFATYITSIWKCSIPIPGVACKIAHY